ncbi:hypothetical protein Adeg_1365 [Ammonifex degensii KC4]|uniref:Uncharacterized protein n=1 Tax=Ammonifex degensii (strain DSM 10501 / KC4) TaxID=429009 RepID=C9R838_AMMDK|nr:hypothetical protein [Ammonifex degensii]ACX52467.1 hypothetical protein Adeg_1365 [Ammonifex degensii KC4]
MTDLVAGVSDLLQAFRHAQALLFGTFALLFLTAVLRFALWAVFGVLLGEYFSSLAATAVSLGLALAPALGGGLEYLGGSLVSGLLAAHTPYGQVGDAFRQVGDALYYLQFLPF